MIWAGFTGASPSRIGANAAESGHATRVLGVELPPSHVALAAMACRDVVPSLTGVRSKEVSPDACRDRMSRSPRRRHVWTDASGA
jgi:hypothetical protein